MADEDDTTHVHTLDFDKRAGERGAIQDDYEGVFLICPHCRETPSLSHVIKDGYCLFCRREITIYAEFEGVRDA